MHQAYCQIHYRKFHQSQLNYYKVVKHWQPLRRVPGGGIGNPAPRQSSFGEATRMSSGTQDGGNAIKASKINIK